MQAHDMSLIGLFLQADYLVKAVMILLGLSSVVCWGIILDRSLRLIRLKRQASRFEDEAVHAPLDKLSHGPLADSILTAAHTAWQDGTPDETRSEVRDRIERSMRSALARELRHLEAGLPFLATIGSAAPFIGLFGTVWGIMNSFTAIAQSQDTSLAVVAPGIAEALFATAIGLAAAIPAVMAYNKLAVDLGRVAQQMEEAISAIGNRLARQSVRASSSSGMSQAAE